MDIDPGTVVANRYRISRPLGRGGMGEVFAAENIRTGRPVAVKLLRSDTKTKSSAVARFRQEARAAGSINSDHVTQVLDVEEDAEHGVVLVFELLEGESLIDRLKRTGPITLEELFPIIEQVWMGLADAHRVGIVHRDLKPSNVFLERRPDGSTRVKILDFGISKIPKEIGGETLTEMGQSLGTFSFMPPEQIGKAKTVDHRADIYACATMIYQSLSGQLPYSARNILVMVEMKAKTDGRPLAEAMGAPVDPKLEAFLTRGLARDPNQRFQSAHEALAAWRELKPMSRAATIDPSSARSSSSARTALEAASQRSMSPYPGSLETPQPQIQPLPIIDMNTDTAATLAMPNPHHASHVGHAAHLGSAGHAAQSGHAGLAGRGPDSPPRVDPRMDAPPAAPPRGVGLGGTQPVIVGRIPSAISPIARQTQSNLAAQAQSSASLPLPPRSPSTAPVQQVQIERPTDLQVIRPEDSIGSYDEPPKTGSLQPHPAGYYLPPAVAASLAQVRTTSMPGTNSGPPQSPAPSTGPGGNPATSSQVNLPKLIDDPTSVPASSSVQTTVYRPDRAAVAALKKSAPAAKGAQKPRRSLMGFVIAALACGLLGFAVVAAYQFFRR
ncbi:MAG: protein kinase [Byssovorax sp.]